MRALIIVILLGLIFTAGIGILAWYGLEKGWFNFLNSKTTNQTLPRSTAFLTFYDQNTNERIEANIDLNLHNAQIKCLSEEQFGTYKNNQSLFKQRYPDLYLKNVQQDGCFVERDWLTYLMSGKMLRGYNAFNLITNNSYIAYANSEGYYVQKHGFFLKQNMTIQEPLRKFLTNTVINATPKTLQGEQESTINLTINGTGYYDYVGACLKWTFGITNAWIDWRETDINPTRFRNYDRCFESGIQKSYEDTINITVHVKTGVLSGADLLTITVYDKERRRISDEIEWQHFTENTTNADVGAPDFEINITP